MNKNFLQPLKVWDFIDSPEVLDCSVTAIPGSGSSPLQVVASLSSECHALAVRDGIQTEFVGVYKGQTGNEALECIICGPGNDIVQGHFKAGERVSLRSMGASDITSGSLVLQFLSHT